MDMVCIPDSRIQHSNRYNSEKVKRYAMTYSCISLLRNPRIILGTLLTSISFGLTIALVILSYVNYNQPTIQNLLSWRIASADGKSQFIVLHYNTPIERGCIRHNDFSLYRDLLDKPREYYHLANIIGGLGFGSATTNYDLFLSIPPGFPPGKWVLSRKVEYECQPFNLVRYMITYDPIPVEIP